MLALLLLSAGCRRGPDTRVAFDFAESFPRAEVQTETSVIDFGTPEARRYLLEGWSGDEGNSQLSFAWAMGDHSSVRVFIATPRPLRLEWRCQPFSFEHAPPQTVTVVVNGQPVGTVTLSDGMSDYAVPIPAAALVSGENRLVFQYAYSRRPWDTLAPAQSQNDTRPLAVAWDMLRIQGGESFGTPRVDTTEDHIPALIVPYASRVDYYLKIPSGSVLSIKDLVPWGAAEAGRDGSYLQVELQTDAAGTRTIELPLSGEGARTISLPVASPLQVTRLSFRAVPGTAPSATAPKGIEVKQPELRSPAAPLPPSADCRQPPDAPKRPNVLVYLIDTLRADHLGCYGYPKGTTPNIDAFARSATQFSNAVAQSSWTRPAVASIFTGLTPPSHGVNGKEDVLAPMPTLASLLQDAGYETAAVFTNSQLAPTFGLDHGFRTYTYLTEDEKTVEIYQLSDRLNEAAFAWLDQRPTDRPFFLYLHAVDPHGPYTPRSPYRERFAGGVADPSVGGLSTLYALEYGELTASPQLTQDLLALYDAEIAFVDEQFGLLLQKLKDLGVYDSTLIVLLADHGEGFGDHEIWQHGTSLFAEQTNIPLIMKFPAHWMAGQTTNAMAQQVDILPTILDYVHAAVPPTVQGASLLPLLACPNRPADRFAYSYFRGIVLDVEAESITDGQLKLIHNLRSNRPRPAVALYDRGADPTEAHDLADERPIEVGYLRSRLHGFDAVGAPVSTPSPAVIDQAVRERLRALGYLH